MVSNTKNIKNVSYYKIPLVDENKKQNFFLFNEPNSQLNTLKTSYNKKTEETIKKNIKVVTLNNFSRTEKTTKIDLLRIDTEGCELDVLKESANFTKKKQIRSIFCKLELSFRNSQLNYRISFIESSNYLFVGLYNIKINYYNEGLAYSNA